MDKELIEKVREMTGSGQYEMVELGRLLFWTSDPTFEEYELAGGKDGIEGYNKSIEISKKIYKAKFTKNGKKI